MRCCLVLLALSVVGCGGSSPPPNQSTPTKPTPVGGEKTPTLIAWDKPEFTEMINALTANPGDAKYKDAMLRLEMTLDSNKEIKKEHYEATGKTGAVNVRTTFFTPPNSQVNSQIRVLKAGDKVNFFCKLDSFKPGAPRPELQVRDPSIMSVDQAD